MLLNQAITQAIPEAMGLIALEEKRGPLWEGLLAMKTANPSEIPDLVLHANQRELLHESWVEYAQKLEMAVYTTVAFRAVSKGEWEVALKAGAAGARFITSTKDTKHEIKKNLPRDAVRVLLLYFCVEISKSLQSEQKGRLL